MVIKGIVDRLCVPLIEDRRLWRGISIYYVLACIIESWIPFSICHVNMVCSLLSLNVL